MPQRFICPHCHSPIDPQTMDRAACAGVPCRICPECDEPVPLAPEALATEAAQ
jgi:hypothetical protein